jgi:hypothetical protein
MRWLLKELNHLLSTKYELNLEVYPTSTYPMSEYPEQQVIMPLPTQKNGSTPPLKSQDRKRETHLNPPIVLWTTSSNTTKTHSLPHAKLNEYQSSNQWLQLNSKPCCTPGR